LQSFRQARPIDLIRLCGKNWMVIFELNILAVRWVAHKLMRAQIKAEPGVCERKRPIFGWFCSI